MKATKAPQGSDRRRSDHHHGPSGHEGRGHDLDVASILDQLRSSGARVTTARRLLVAALLDGPDHRSAEELASVVQAVGPDISLSTIYRNLEELERLGIVVHVHFGHGPAVFHLAPVAHGHLVCTSCGAVLEAPDAIFEELAAATSSRFGFTLDAHHFAIPGLCGSCATSTRADTGAATSKAH